MPEVAEDAAANALCIFCRIYQVRYFCTCYDVSIIALWLIKQIIILSTKTYGNDQLQLSVS